MFCRSICMRAVRENFVWLLCSSVVVWAILSFLCKILRILCPCGPVWWYEWYHLCFKLSSAVLYSYMLADMSQTSSEWHTQHRPPPWHHHQPVDWKSWLSLGGRLLHNGYRVHKTMSAVVPRSVWQCNICWWCLGCSDGWCAYCQLHTVIHKVIQGDLYDFSWIL